MTAPGQPLVRETGDPPEPGPAEVRVRVAGCGVCHTDLGFLYGGVRTKHELPLALGHEIAGIVEAAGAGAEEWLGREVVVPAVLPCGECDLCRSGHECACRAQLMPGNDFHGGFASHLVVPARWLVPAGDLPDGLQLADVAVLADAVTTPYQAMVRAETGAGDHAVLIGAGGIGGFGVQIAAALGARIIAVDIDDARLERAAAHGACATVNTRGLEAREARQAVQAACREAGFPSHGLKVFEMSGTPAGQELAWSLLTFAGTVAIVGFCLDKVPVRLSNLMAFDARAFGNWGCRPQLYAPALDLIRSGRVRVTPFVRRFPMAEINQVLTDVRHHRIPERPVLVP
ncbi:MAG: 6-hydroxycyclohex-1-ene-1-carbonyl-CoA dehydrogenase [Planctomycetota bacterium]|nr:MAG: 6-hydroxycyclohex-1-ene-1-carbonyl-CoA dehydrogenase [Planctomycetota bacterium]